MSFLITESESELVQDTLPALKLTHWYGTPARGCVYSYLRCFVRAGGMPFGFTVFEENPSEGRHIALAVSLQDDGGKFLLVSCAKGKEGTLQLYENGKAVQSFAMPPLRMTAGGDEQGLYWGAQGVIPKEVFLGVFGCVPEAGRMMPGNVFLYDEKEKAFGAAFPVPEWAAVPSCAGTGSFLVVPY